MTDGELDFDPEELAMLRQLFRREAHDALESVTARLLSAGSTAPTGEALTEMMRATHTLKGAAGTVGLHAMVDLAHRLEDVFAAFRRAPAQWTTKTSDVLVEVIDALREYVDMMSEPNADAAAEELRMTLDQLAQLPRAGAAASDLPRTPHEQTLAPPADPNRAPASAATAAPPADPNGAPAGAPDAALAGPNEALAGAAEAAPPADTNRAPGAARPADSQGAPADAAEAASLPPAPRATPPAIHDAVPTTAPPDTTPAAAPRARRATGPAGAASARRASVPAAADVDRDEVDQASGAGARAPSDDVVEAVPQAVRDAETQPVPWAMAAGARAAREAREARSAIDAGLLVEPRSWLRIEPERVDEVVSSAGELLFDRTRIERRVQLLRTLARDLARTRQALHDAIADDSGASPTLRNAVMEAEGELAGQAALLSQTTAALLDEVEALRRTIGELQRGLTRIRMESARSLMLHAARTLRALRRATGARVELHTFGEDTEFDKAVAEQLFDPVTQLLRNAVAHGIELPEERAAHGKAAVATITLRARQEGNSVVLEVGDDGRGIDTAALKQRLVASGRWTEAHAQLADDGDVLAALLDTEVSSRGEADELAGRGVGIGLVRQTVARLGGEVKVASVAGKGTTFTLRLPVTAALAQAMLFKVDGQVYALPGVNVVETTSVEALAETATVRDEVLPVVRLDQLLGRGPANDRRPALVVSFAGKRLVCTVDKLIGPREITVKPLGPLLAPLTLYAGATISGSGKVQLILDPAQLVQRAYPDAPRSLLAPGTAPTMLAGRALVVDDSRAIREAMTSMLGSEGWIVDVAEDGGRALRMARQVRYDLVVTDLEMPGLTGFELIARLRDDERMIETPVVVITSRATPDHRRRARELAVRALVAKPITRRKLLEALAAR